MMTQSILKKYNFARIDIDDKYIILSDSEEDVQKNSYDLSCGNSVL